MLLQFYSHLIIVHYITEAEQPLGPNNLGLFCYPPSTWDHEVPDALNR